MISTFFLTIFYSFVGFLLVLLPSGHLPAVMTSAFSYFVGVANLFSFVVPVDTLLAAALVILLFDGAIIVWHFINWVIRKIPGMQ